MKWWTFKQNNSGGSWRGPAIFVCVQANSEHVAVAMAEEQGCYFDGEGDCPCCGNRWSYPWDGGTDGPEIYGQTPEQYLADPSNNIYQRWAAQDKLPICMLVYADGTTKTLGGEPCQDDD